MTTIRYQLNTQLRQERLADGDVPDIVAADVARSRAPITDAPVVVVCLSRITGAPTHATSCRNESTAVRFYGLMPRLTGSLSSLPAAMNPASKVRILEAPLFAAIAR